MKWKIFVMAWNERFQVWNGIVWKILPAVEDLHSIPYYALVVAHECAALTCVIVTNDYNMTRDIEGLYSDEKIDNSNFESDVVIKDIAFDV